MSVENILTIILGGGNLILFIKFLVERHDRKQERAEDRAREEKEKAEAKEKEDISKSIKKLEKDGLRTQLLLLILLKPEEQQEILTIAEHYFVDLQANWYMSGIFKTWCSENNLKPDWFDEKGEHK